MIYDPYSREMQLDPYPTYRHFRDDEPCHYNPERDFYALFRFEDVWNATLDWESYSSSWGPMLEHRGDIPEIGMGAVVSYTGFKIVLQTHSGYYELTLDGHSAASSHDATARIYQTQSGIIR